MQLIINKDLMDEFAEKKNIFAQIMCLKGKAYRELENRRTIELEINGQTIFAKIHQGIGYLEFLKNISCLRLPICSAYNEWLATTKLASLGVPVLEILGFGNQGVNPAKKQSFLITKALKNNIALDSFLATNRQLSPIIKRDLIKKVASILAIMHTAKIAHRDCYLCHFLLQEDKSTNNFKLTLIDLHRAIKPKFSFERWLIKDLAGIYFSSRDLGFTKRDILRFLKNYHANLTLREILSDFAKRFKKIEERAIKTYNKFLYKHPLYVKNAISEITNIENSKEFKSIYLQVLRMQISRLKNTAFDNFNKFVKKRRFNNFLLYKKDHSEIAKIFALDVNTILHRKENIFLKNGDSSVVVISHIKNKKFVIKQYLFKDFARKFRRQFKISRAKNAWFASDILQFLNIPTPKAIACLEKRLGPIIRTSYLLTEKLSGITLDKYLDKSSKEQRQNILRKLEHILSVFKEVMLIHGDFKATNFLVANDELYVLDLDTMQQIKSVNKFNKLFKKDIARLLRNWEEGSEIRITLNKILQERVVD